MTFDQFIAKWLYKKADWDNFYQGQCVDLFRYYCDEVLEISQPAGVWGAGNFWSDFDSDPILVANFTKVANTADFVPTKGDVVIWNFYAGGGYGHIAIATGDNSGLQYFKSFDQNWSKISYCEIVNHNYKNVWGVLRPKKNINEGGNMADEMMQISKADFEKLRKNSESLDAIAGYLKLDPNLNAVKYIEKITKLEIELAELKVKNSNYEEKFVELKEGKRLAEENLGIVEGDLIMCKEQTPQAPNLEAYTNGYSPTGRKIIEVQGDMTIETSFEIEKK